jgi:3-deoxy-7-phosphoheptulonate synthase
MIVVMKRGASISQTSAVIKKVEELGFKAHPSRGTERTLIGILGKDPAVPAEALNQLPGVEQIIPVAKPFKLVNRQFRSMNTVISINGVTIGGAEVIVMAGPCAVESREQLLEAAVAVKEAGAKILRGGAFKPRTSPYDFQGLGKSGLEILAEARELTGLAVVTEVMSPTDVSLVARYADILQIGARNMQNYSLLEAVGGAGKPVLLKRGMMCTLEELLMSAEYIVAAGNSEVILCERGIRTFERYTRNTLDISAVPVIKKYSHLPIVLDPSHSTGNREFVSAASCAAVAAGADGLIVEVHPQPDSALCDGAQSLTVPEFSVMMQRLEAVAAAVGRRISAH